LGIPVPVAKSLTIPVFEIWEIAGWDLVSAICTNLFPTLDNSTGVPPVLKEMVERGDLGTKSGKGFYAWDPQSILSLKNRIAQMLIIIERGRAQLPGGR
jgi:3-hydroxybutyryl-CoA dehydrogenase